MSINKENKNIYKKDSIESLSPLEFTRLRPGVYAGDTTYSTQLLIEIVSNAVDEFRLGHGDKIKVSIVGDVVAVTDEGQGFLVNEIRDDGKTVLEAAFSVLNTSGKYHEDGTYEGVSLGSFGIGSKITNYLAHWLNVSTARDGECESIKFIEGEFSSRDIIKVPKEQHGTSVQWKPSEEFFTHTEVDIVKIKSLFKTIVCLCPGLTIELNNNGKEEIFFSKNGLNDLVDDYVKDTELINNRLKVAYAEGKYKLDLIMTYTSNYSSSFVSYVNTGLIETSPILTQIKTTITKEMNKFFREKKWLTDKNENLTSDDLQEGMFLVFNATCPNVAYDSQVKTRVVSMDCKSEVAAFGEKLISWLNNNEKEVKNIADKAINAFKAREAAKKAREAARLQKDKKRKKVINPDKLKDAEHLGQDSILLAVEGSSASSSMAVARDISKVGILGLKGKLINLLTNKQEKVAKNEEIQLLISALGIDINNYNSKDLRYGKIAITTDADSDGYHIGLLIASALYVLCPQFIKENRLCWLRSPLYIVKNNKKELYYYTDEELDRAKENGEVYGEVQRAKGLGSLSAEQAKNSMFTDEFQRLDVLEYSEEALSLLADLMGNDVAKRKDFVFNNVDFSTIRE